MARTYGTSAETGPCALTMDSMSTMSLRSSIYDFVEENGRTYHRYKQGKYWMPNDKVSAAETVLCDQTETDVASRIGRTRTDSVGKSFPPPGICSGADGTDRAY